MAKNILIRWGNPSTSTFEEIHPFTKTTNVLDSTGKSVEQRMTELEGNSASESTVNSHINATTGVHGATSSNTANRIVQRDGSGRIHIGDATSATHAVNRQFGDGRYALKGSANTFTAAQTIQNLLRLTSTAESGLIQAGANSSDSNARLRVARNGTTSTPISLFEIFAGTTEFTGNVDLSGRVRGTNLTTGETQILYHNASLIVLGNRSTQLRLETAPGTDIIASVGTSVTNVALEGRQNVFDPKQHFSNGIRVQNGGVSPSLDIHYANNQYEFYPTGSGFQKPIMIGRSENPVRVQGQTSANYRVRNVADGSSASPPSGMQNGDIYHQW